jgi:hypothetical protein
MADQGTPLDSACRIIILEDQLAEALRLNEQAQHHNPSDKEAANDGDLSVDPPPTR